MTNGPNLKQDCGKADEIANMTRILRNHTNQSAIESGFIAIAKPYVA